MKNRTLPRMIGIFLCMLLLARPAAWAGGDPPVLKVLQGMQIHADSSIQVEDSKFFDPSYNSLLIKPYTVKNIVTFRINEEANVLLKTAFTASVTLRIISTRADNSVDSVDKNFAIAYDPAGTYNAIASYPYSGAYRVTVKVISASTNAGWNVWAALSVENELESMPAYQFSCTTDTIGAISFGALVPDTQADELPVSWSNKITADEYDLEWTYVDSSALSAGTYGDSAHPNPLLIFDNNATRVTITGTSYKIPLIYDDKGTLFFRVRAAQLKADGTRFEANWSSDNTAGLGRFVYNGHQRNLNWQATTSFAEEGKRKIVVQYYDGSLRARQTVTKDNTTNTTIASESYYDYQGRPAIQVLPAPTLSTVIKYSQNFNTGLNGSAYDKDNFDVLVDPTVYCNAGAGAMSTDSGAARYYSPNDPLKDSGFHRFIPDAGGYPFSEKEYTQDNTGRISRQGGVGPTHQLGTGHETKYFYGTPDQQELDALFGTEVGDHSHYYKTMVRDANGQYSVSYTDMHGRTIATALAGSPPDSIHLDKLPSYDSALVTISLADSSTNVIKDLVMESSKGLLVEKAGLHTFTYQLNPASLQKPGCDNTPVCYDCLYDLEISITDDCNNQKLGGHAFDTTLHNFSLSAIDTTCSNSAAGFNFSFSKYLVEGSYDITKRLSVSRYGMDYYRDSVFIRKNTCKTVDSFINEQRSIQAAIELCKPTCQHCTDSLGTMTQFSTRFKQHAGIASGDTSYNGLIAQAYSQALADCNALCNKTSEYDDIRQAMLLDMTPPSGQYANPDLNTDIYSVFYALTPGGSSADTIPDYVKATNYLDDYGNPDKVYDEEADAMVAPQQLSMNAFVRKFKLSWAEALLPYHPEYCKLQKYQALQASLSWDARFNATDTYADAMKKGYLNPTSNTAAPFNKYNAAVAADIDSIIYFSGHDYKSELEAQLLRFRNNSFNSSSGLSMWSMANLTVLCKDNSTAGCFSTYANEANVFNAAAQCTGDLDMAWRTFRQMYQDVKREKINAQLKALPCSSTPTAQTLLTAGHQPHFSDATEMVAANGIPTPADYTSVYNYQQTQQANVTAYYSSNCRAYVAQWFQQLAPCNYTTADTAVIMPLLVQVCEQGSDPEHPYGASSVNPTSTNTYKSFEDVINTYNASHGITNITTCNPYLITAPKPYDQQSAYSYKPIYDKPDDCECNRINSLYSDYQKLSGQYASFSAYLQEEYNTTISDSVLNLLRNLCSTTSACTFLPAPVQLPPAMQCYSGDICISCLQFHNMDSTFRSLYPGITPVEDSVAANDSVQLRKNRLYDGFMNYRLGFTKSTTEYLAFSATCTGATSFSCGAAYDSTFRKTYRTGNGPDKLRDMLETSDGGYIMAGSTGNIDSFQQQALIIKTDKKGNIQWSKTYLLGSGLNHEFTKIRATADGGYIAAGRMFEYTYNSGSGSYDGFSFMLVAKLDAYGATTWSRFIDLNQLVSGEGDIIQTADHGYAVLANMIDSADWTVLRLDSIGNMSWSKSVSFGETKDVESSFNDEPVTQHWGVFYRASILEDNNALVIAGGQDPGYYGGDGWLPYNITFTKLDKANGNIIWDKRITVGHNDDFGFYTNISNTRVQRIFKTSAGTYRAEVTDGQAYDIRRSQSDIDYILAHPEYFIYNWPFLYGLADPTEYDYSHICFGHYYVDVDTSGGFIGGNYNADLDGFDGDGYDEFTYGAKTTVMCPTSDGGYVSLEGVPDSLMIWQKNDGGSNYLLKKEKTLIGQFRFRKLRKLVQHSGGYFAGAGMFDDAIELFTVDPDLNTGCVQDKPYDFKYAGLQLVQTEPDMGVEYVGPVYFGEASLSVTTVSPTVLDSVNCPTACHPLSGPTLCGRAGPVFPPVSLDLVDNCIDSSFFAVSKGTELYNDYRDSLINNFDSSYRSKCMQAYKLESFTVTRTTSQYHYTLYYYDQAGNLLKTIAPGGVHPNFNSLWLDSVKTARANGMLKAPAHVMPTQYRYNTLNQVVAQQTPDAGLSTFWYDRLGRLAISQNARQSAASASENGRQYSYTQYDYLGRINEVGQVTNTGTNGTMSDSISRSESLLGNWLTALANNKEQVTRTYYDLAYPALNSIPLSAVNLRNRVAYTTYTDGNSTTAYNQATFYSYNIHGNADTILQDYGSSLLSATQNIMNANNARWKRIAYQYDLISGKVNMVAYNAPYWDITTGTMINPADVFYHRYSYDAENRLTLVETSKDSILWEKDARYEYYLHGPLAREVLGHQQVQGLDYAYTLQGWLKGVNSTTLRSMYDMGEDGSIGGAHQYIARDVVGFNLNYFNNDYTPVEHSLTPFANAAVLGSSGRPLYNGNISSMAVNIGGFNQPYLYNYRYDQLNRLSGQDAYTGLDTTTNSWSGLTITNSFKERVRYDGDGNILHYDRYWSNVSPIMDSLDYHYAAGTNRLSYLSEAGSSYSSVNGSNDIEDQPSGNYAYDEIGNLIKDSIEHIPQGGIKWNIYGKITEIDRTSATANSNTRQIRYSYDAAGNRIGKKTTYFGSAKTDYTWYVHDAQGNTLHVYAASMDTSSGTSLTDFNLLLGESYIFGSSRAGELNRNINAERNASDTMIYGNRGQKFYEITNHLKNVLTIISDKKYGVPDPSDTSKVGWYTADVIKATDYYPFGMISRQGYYGNNNYRFGFNGKENDSDVKGDGEQQDYGNRIYDPRVGRFLSVDPLMPKYAYYSPYQFTGDNPIAFVDLDGQERFSFIRFQDKTGQTVLALISVEDIYEKVVSSRTAVDNGMGGVTYDTEYKNVKNNHQEYIVWQVGSLPNTTDIPNQEWEYDEHHEYKTAKDALNAKDKDFEGTDEDIEMATSQGVYNAAQKALDELDHGFEEFGPGEGTIGKRLIRNVQSLDEHLHHLISRGLKRTSQFVKKAIEGGFKIDGKQNLTPVTAFIKRLDVGVHAKHMNYTKQIASYLEDLDITKFTPVQAKELLLRLNDHILKKIKENPTTKLNDLNLDLKNFNP